MRCVRRFATKAKTAKTSAKGLDGALRLINDSFGKGSIMKLGSREAVTGVDVISTGSIGLDSALGIGGLPKGRIVEIYGPESSGKTTLALHVVAEAQKSGGNCAIIDAEHAVDADYAGRLGVNLEDLYISQPDSGEEALEICDILAKSGEMDVIVVDSVAALVPRAELDGEMGDHHIALQARLMSQALRKLTGSISRSKCLLIFINQIRSKVGVIFGSPEVTSGGRALAYFSSVRLDIRRLKAIKLGDEIVGTEARVKIAKNKLAPPFREAKFDMIFGAGIDRQGELLDVAVEKEIVLRSGSWFSFASAGDPVASTFEGDAKQDVIKLLNGTNFAQGREKAKAFFRENPDIGDSLENLVRYVPPSEARGDEASRDGEDVQQQKGQQEQAGKEKE
jgi:recombination protein RecA